LLNYLKVFFVLSSASCQLRQLALLDAAGQ
jgi:hypothetical protein